MNLTAAEFRGLPDLPRVKAFLRGRQQQHVLPDYWTLGKSTVGTYQTIFDSNIANHRFWSDATGQYQAYLWLHPVSSQTIVGNANSWRMLLHPPERTTAVADMLIACAEQELDALADPGFPKQSIATVAYGGDRWLASQLTEHGYIKGEPLEVYMRRSLDESIAEPRVADGYTIRPFDAEHDVVQRAGAQSDAFAGEPEPGPWALENTQRFLRWYEGREDLDLVAVAASGEIAAFAVFLVDTGTLAGELDPVGTRAAHQRRGLSKTVLLSGLLYLQSKGMEHAVVRTEVENTAAIRTYESVGFEIVDRLFQYKKQYKRQDKR